MFRLFPFVANDPNEVGGGAAPWAADIAARFEDETVRGQVDAYLRETWQPRMTKLETEAAAASQAAELYDDLQGDKAAETFLAIGHALFGEEAAEQIVGVLSAETPATTEETPVVTPQTPAEPVSTEPIKLDALPPEVQAAVQAEQERARAAEWQSELSRVKSEHFAEDAANFREREFALSVVACEGDVDKAVDHYNTRMAELIPAPAEPVVPEAPAALGTQPGAGGGTADAPVAESFDSLDAALDSFLADVKTPAPPAIGTV